MNFTMDPEITKPFLTEPGVKSFLNSMLKQCHSFKLDYHNYMINIGLFSLFLFILGGLLYYKYKGKLSEQEKKQRDYEKQQYILSKIKKYKIDKQRMNEQLITGLPHWDVDNNAF
jgi:hypothetical protein